MNHLIYQIACNPDLPLTTRYGMARHLQQLRKKQKQHEQYVRQKIRKFKMKA